MVRRMYNKILIGALLLALIGPVMGGDKEALESQVVKAMDLALDGDDISAISISDGILDIDPSNEWALLAKGTAYANLGEKEKAKECFEKIDSSEPNLWFAVGRVYDFMGTSQEATDALNYSIELGIVDEENADVLLAMSKTFYRSEVYDRAQYCIEKAIEIDPENAILWGTLGAIYFEQGKYLKGIEASNKAIDIDPYNPIGWNNKAINLMAIGSLIDAEECLDKATDLDPADGMAWYNKGRTYQLMKRYPEALECFNKVLSLNPDSIEAWYRKYEIAQALGDEGSAEEYKAEVDRLDTDSRDRRIGFINLDKER